MHYKLENKPYIQVIGRKEVVMKHMKLILFFCVFAVINASGQSMSIDSKMESKKVDSPTLTDVEWKTLEETNYSLDYPEDWEIDQSGDWGMIVYVLSPLASPMDFYRENATFLTEDLKGLDMGLDEYYDLSLQNVRLSFPGLKVVDESTETVDGLEYKKIIYTAQFEFYKLKFAQISYIQNDRAFVMTFTSEESQFDTYKNIGEKILTSFKGCQRLCSI